MGCRRPGATGRTGGIPAESEGAARRRPVVRMPPPCGVGKELKTNWLGQFGLGPGEALAISQCLFEEMLHTLVMISPSARVI